MRSVVKIAERRIPSRQRVAAVALFRQLADKLEREELRGARVEWREGLDHAVVVELDQAGVRLDRVRLDVE